MNWDQYRSTMEQSAIKTDDMASEDAYFMATHMPFSNLSVIEGGRTEDAAASMSEDEVYESLIWNPENNHRLIIVRGDNGTGKSHLIRYLKARFEGNSAHYTPEREQLIFLRRLNNSVRGVFSQLLEQKVIKDPEVEVKLKKFVASATSRDEASFKNDILLAYIGAVMSDTSGQTYPPIICRNISQYLSDSRVQDQLLRDNNAIFRCYQVITAPSDQVLKETTIFTENDFKLDRRVEKELLQISANPGAQDFAGMLKADENEVKKLVSYLNRFTPKVVQRCADISSESTKSIFEQLRRDLKKQGKNLTLFIEDFTGFTGIDSELITVLSTEHGGAYSDLCRVTAIIGITNGYYSQFKDNFKDRVTHQISVTENSYGNIEFLSQMAARYLNAIYCPPVEVKTWFDQGALLPSLPVNTFCPPCEWESETLVGHEISLYPFTRKSLFAMYEALAAKTPRMFLLDVIRRQLKEYFDGKEYGTDWAFPTKAAITGNLLMSNAPHSSSIDKIDTLSSVDKARLKTILNLWGDGSAQRIQKGSSLYIGGVNLDFLTDIGLGAFPGIGDIHAEKGDKQSVATNVDTPPTNTDTPPAPPRPPIDPAEQKRHREYRRHKDDIEAWFANGAKLQYHPDFRKWLLDFIRESINWQADGVPAYIAHERLSDLSVVFIDGQADGESSDKTILSIEKSSESKDVLNALCDNNYSDGWVFDGSAFYQQKLITWLERSKPIIVARVCGVDTNQEPVPICEWCLAIQYIKAQIMGYQVNTSSPLSLLKSLLSTHTGEKPFIRETKEWQDIISFVNSEEAAFSASFDLLNKSSNTTMGAIQGSRTIATPMFRASELLDAVQSLYLCGWDIRASLPDVSRNANMLFNPAALLRKLYYRIDKVVEAERDSIDDLQRKLAAQVGALSEDNLISLVNAVQSLYKTFNSSGIFYSPELASRFARAPIEKAKEVMKTKLMLDKAIGVAHVEALGVFSSNGSKALADFLNDILEIERLAQQERVKAERELRNFSGDVGTDEIAEAARQDMATLYDRIEAMEVQNAD